MSSPTAPSPERRSFLARFHAGASSLAALAMGGIAMAQVKVTTAAPFAPTRHSLDDWLEQGQAKHRLVIDTTSAESFSDSMLYANAFLTANRTDYGLQSQDLSIIIVARHTSTGYAFNEAMWAKYGVTLNGAADAASKEPLKANPNAMSIASLSGQGVQFAVCSVATRRLAGQVARATGGNADAAFAELTSNLVNNGRMVPAGIVAVNRAQERGYSLARA